MAPFISVSRPICQHESWPIVTERDQPSPKKYGIKLLVWYETYDMVTDAIQRETTLKHWLRKWKLDLIEKSNPNWDDLYETF